MQKRICILEHLLEKGHTAPIRGSAQNGRQSDTDSVMRLKAKTSAHYIGDTLSCATDYRGTFAG